MNKAQTEYAVRKAYENLDKWNEITGFVKINSGYYCELLSIIEDSIHIGIQMALKGKIKYDKMGNVVIPDNT